jgi:hypothetical protein
VAIEGKVHDPVLGIQGRQLAVVPVGDRTLVKRFRGTPGPRGRRGRPRRFGDRVERDGLTMEFHSMHRPLETYTDALHASRFTVDVLREPVPDADARYPRLAREVRVPWYLHLRATRT